MHGVPQSGGQRSLHLPGDQHHTAHHSRCLILSKDDDGRTCAYDGIRPYIHSSPFHYGGKLLLGILKESAPCETRVALLPESLKSLKAQGIAITVEAGAGIAAGASDAAYTDACAVVTTDRGSILATADLLPVVNTPSA